MDNLPLDYSSTINKKKSWIKKSGALYIVIILILIALGAGFLIGYSQKKVQIVTEYGQISEGGQEYGVVSDKTAELPEFLTKDVSFNLFWEVWNKIQNNYIDRPIGETKLLYGALNGVVASLKDPYSIFLEPEPAKEFSNDLSGKFEGIGAEIGMRDGILTIISPLPESPAEKAGLRAKDRVTQIDGVTTENMSLNEAVLNIRGEKGTTVNLKIYREADNKFHDIPIMRDTIKIVSVTWEMKEDNIAYIKVTNFNQDTDSRFRAAANELLLKNPKGIILDLRSNPGGYLDRAVDMASYWLDAGQTVVKEEFANALENKSYSAHNETLFKGYPTVVLVNGGSASGSEIVAGALQDHGVATLVGETTFGKGSVQSLEDLSDGSALKLTIARWLTPNGRQINVTGIEPNEVVELTEEDYKEGRDPQLDKALEILTNSE